LLRENGAGRGEEKDEGLELHGISKDMATQKKCAARERILQAAGELFGKFGYDRTTLEGICRKMGKAKTSIYYYYDGKQALLKDIVGQEFARLREQLEPVMVVDENLTSAKIRAYLKERIKLVLEMQVYPQFIVNQYSEADDDARAAVREIRAEFDRWEREKFFNVCCFGRQNGILPEAVKPDAFADMIQMLLKGIESQMVISKNRESDLATYEAMVDFLIRDCSKSHGTCAPNDKPSETK
jgi:AcrR family transcriptional regulator